MCYVMSEQLRSYYNSHHTTLPFKSHHSQHSEYTIHKTSHHNTYNNPKQTLSLLNALSTHRQPIIQQSQHQAQYHPQHTVQAQQPIPSHAIPQPHSCVLHTVVLRHCLSNLIDSLRERIRRRRRVSRRKSRRLRRRRQRVLQRLHPTPHTPDRHSQCASLKRGFHRVEHHLITVQQLVMIIMNHCTRYGRRNPNYCSTPAPRRTDRTKHAWLPSYLLQITTHAHADRRTGRFPRRRGR